MMGRLGVECTCTSMYSIMLLFKSNIMVMQIGPRAPDYNYILCQQLLSTTDTVRDLGILVSRNLIFSEFINGQVIVIKANRIFGMIRRTFLRLDQKTFTLL
jgi:hypothetical protein